jgi:hypothetical protein
VVFQANTYRFAPVPDASFGDYLGGAALGDFNGDGIPDLALLAYFLYDLDAGLSPSGGTEVLIAYGDGGGGFGPLGYPLVNQTWRYGLVTGDVNGDGLDDLVIGTWQSDSTESESCYYYGLPGVVVAYGRGDGGFDLSSNMTLPGCDLTAFNAWPQLAVADLNSDGRRDIVLMGEYTGVAIFYSLADGGFALSQIPPPPEGSYLPGFDSIAVADVNGDGRNDLLAVYGQPEALTYQLLVWLQQVDGGLELLPLYGPIFNPGGVIGGTESIDLVANDAQVLGMEDGGLTSIGTYPFPPSSDPSGLSYWVVGAGDVNGDGVSDLLVVGTPPPYIPNVVPQFIAMLGHHGGSFGNGVALSLDPTLSYGQIDFPVLTGDLNGDGRMDAVVVSSPVPVDAGFTFDVQVLISTCSPRANP